MITPELKKLVKQEADNLRKYASQEVRERLDADHLDFRDQYCCVYGQMAGDCFNSYATKLLNQCTAPFSKSHVNYKNGSLKNSTFSNHRSEVADETFYSPIEFYISQIGAKNENLIRYIKGETDKLEL